MHCNALCLFMDQTISLSRTKYVVNYSKLKKNFRDLLHIAGMGSALGVGFNQDGNSARQQTQQQQQQQETQQVQIFHFSNS